MACSAKSPKPDGIDATDLAGILTERRSDWLDPPDDAMRKRLHHETAHVAITAASRSFDSCGRLSSHSSDDLVEHANKASFG